MPCFSASLRHSSTWKLCPGCAKLGAVGVSSRDVPRMLQACSLPLLAFSAFARGLYIGCVALGRFELKAVMRPAGTGAILTCSWRCKLKPHSAAACAAYEMMRTPFRQTSGRLSGNVEWHRFVLRFLFADLCLLGGLHMDTVHLM